MGGKFFDSESEDYEKELAATLPRPPSVLDKVLEKEFEFKLTHRIVTIDRDAERRYQFALIRNTILQAKGEEGVGESSPMKETWIIKNDDAESNAGLKNLHRLATMMAEDKDCPPELSKLLKEGLAKGVPATGEEVSVEAHLYLMNQLSFYNNVFDDVMENLPANWTADETEKMEDLLWEARREIGKESIIDFYKLQNEIEEDVEDLKTIYRSQSASP